MPLRTRLTAWYALVLAGTLLLYIAGTSFVLYLQFSSQLAKFAIQDVETIEGLLYFRPNGQLLLNEDYHNHAASRQILERFLEVVTPSGKVLYRNSRLGSNALGGKPFEDEGIDGYSERSTQLKDGTSVLLVSRRHTLEGHPLVIRLAYDKRNILTRIEEFLTASFTALPVLLAVIILMGHHLTRRALSPLEQMSQRADEITAERLDQRLPVLNPNDELGHLAVAFNTVLDRLQQSFDQLRRFTSDASHELRTPLAAIRSVGEVGLQKSRTPADFQDTIGSMLEEVSRLTKLVESLLTISRADGGQIDLTLTTFAPLAVVEEVVGLVDVLAEERKQTILVKGDPSAEVHGDRLLLRQALVNLLHNAVKYSPAGGEIRVTVERSGEEVSVRIADSGPGIPPEHRSRIFDRFYRVDSGRARDTGGTGLGLSIAQWAIQVQGGVIRILDCEHGSTFSISLPGVNMTA